MVRRHHSLTIINAGTLRSDHEPGFAAIDFVRERVCFWNIIDRQTAIPCDELPLTSDSGGEVRASAVCP
jgi:hypothetical protein